MAEMLDMVRDVAEGQIDFEGQRLADQLSHYTLSACGVVAFIVGFLLQDIKLAMYIGLGGTTLAFALIIPPWPFFKRHPVKWLPAGSGFQFDTTDSTG